MWLINARTYKLEWFSENKIPPYSILSHTWSDDELSFGIIRTHQHRRGDASPKFGRHAV